MSLFSRGGEGYQFFKQGSQKILTLPLNTDKKNCDPPPAIGKKNCDPPHFYSVIFFKTLLPWIELPSQIDSCLTDAQSVSYFF